MEHAKIEEHLRLSHYCCFHRVDSNAELTPDIVFDAGSAIETGSIIGGHG